MRAPLDDPSPASKGTLPDRTRELLTRLDHEDRSGVGYAWSYARRLADLLEEWLVRDGQRTR